MKRFYKQETRDSLQRSSRSVQESERVLSQAEADRLVQQAHHHPHWVVTIAGKTTSRTPHPPSSLPPCNKPLDRGSGLVPKKGCRLFLDSKGLVESEVWRTACNGAGQPRLS